MTAKTLPWLRLYTEIIDDEKLGLLAFEDRWHFVAILCLKGKGVLDSEPDAEMLQRKVALKMGVTLQELEKIVARLARMGLIDRETCQPCAWDTRQMQSDSSTERVKAYRERLKQARNVSTTVQDADTELEKEREEREEKKSNLHALQRLRSSFLSGSTKPIGMHGTPVQSGRRQQTRRSRWPLTSCLPGGQKVWTMLQRWRTLLLAGGRGCSSLTHRCLDRVQCAALQRSTNMPLLRQQYLTESLNEQRFYAG